MNTCSMVTSLSHIPLRLPHRDSMFGVISIAMMIDTHILYITNVMNMAAAKQYVPNSKNCTRVDLMSNRDTGMKLVKMFLQIVVRSHCEMNTQKYMLPTWMR